MIHNKEFMNKSVLLVPNAPFTMSSSIRIITGSNLCLYRSCTSCYSLEMLLHVITNPSKLVQINVQLKSCPHLSVSRLLHWVLVGEGTRKVSWDILLTALSRTNMAASANGNYITSIAPFHNLVCFWRFLDRELFFPLSLRCRRVPLQLLPSGLYVTSSEMCRMHWFRFVSSSKDAGLLLTRWSCPVLIEFCVFVTLFTFGFILVFRLWCRNG